MPTTNVTTNTTLARPITVQFSLYFVLVCTVGEARVFVIAVAMRVVILSVSLLSITGTVVGIR